MFVYSRALLPYTAIMISEVGITLKVLFYYRFKLINNKKYIFNLFNINTKVISSIAFRFKTYLNIPIRIIVCKHTHNKLANIKYTTRTLQ